MKVNEARSILAGNVEAIDQGIRLLDSLTDDQYVYLAAPYVSSSIGQHFRHVLDMFTAISTCRAGALIDYDKRRRGADVEVSRERAIKELNVVRNWMDSRILELEKGNIDLGEDVAIKTEVCIDETHSATLRSTMLRELVFTSSHAVHHYALISVIAKIQGISLEKNLGVAPATATFMRSEASIEDDRSACAQ